MDNLGLLLLALVIGVAVGAFGAWLVLRARATSANDTDAERLRAAEASARADVERARADIAGAHAKASQAEVRIQEARAEAERAQRTVAEARVEAAEASQMAAEQAALVAGLQAKVVAALAERDAASARAAEIAADREAIAKEFQLLSARVLDEQGKKADLSAEQRLKATEHLMTPVRESLEKLDERLNAVEKERVAMATELRQQVEAVRLTGDELRRETSSLSKALRKPQVRGAWGEMQLKRVAEVAGMLEHCDFALQQTSHTSEDRTIRPDMKVLLAEDKYVYVDSKVPLTAFLDAHETSDDAEQQRRLKMFAQNVRSHVDQLSGKNYFKADAGTPEFVVLFLPSEALAAEALSQSSDLHEYAAQRNIVIATPTTLIAMLRAVAYSWKQAALAHSAAEVFTLGRELYDRLGTMGGKFDKLGRSLTSAVKAYNETVGSLESRVLVQARRFRDLQVTGKELAALSPSEESVRVITAPELVEDATRTTPMIGRNRSSVRGRDAQSETLPEADELVRGEPEWSDLLAQTSVTPHDDRGTMAG